MAHKHVFEAVNRTLQHVMGAVDPALKDMFFGGKVIVMGIDFRQILLVVPRGRRGQIVNANVALPSSLWTHLRVQVCGDAEAVGTWGTIPTSSTRKG